MKCLNYRFFLIGHYKINLIYINRKNINVTAKNFVYRSYMYADDMVEWLLTILTSSKNTKNNTSGVN